MQQGFLAAAHLQRQQLPVRVYSDEMRNAVDTFREAIANGAVAVVGPLTRSAIRQLADEKRKLSACYRRRYLKPH